MFFYLALRQKFVFKIISAKFVGNKEFASYTIGEVSKHIIQYRVIDKRLAIALIIEPNAVLAELNEVYWKAGDKMTHDPLFCMSRDTPDPEEPKYVIDTKRIEVVAHLLKPLLPPCKMILLHLFPVVSGKAPVLTGPCKIIRRSPGLPVHIIL